MTAVAVRYRERRATDHAYRERLREKERKRNAEPARREQQKAYISKWKQDNKAWSLIHESRRTGARLGFAGLCQGVPDDEAVTIVQSWLDRKPGHCEFCSKATVKLSLDHNHVTGKVRAWLCSHCNALEGKIANGYFDRLKAFIAERDAS